MPQYLLGTMSESQTIIEATTNIQYAQHTMIDALSDASTELANQMPRLVDTIDNFGARLSSFDKP
jgi:hypothetical protein